MLEKFRGSQDDVHAYVMDVNSLVTECLCSVGMLDNFTISKDWTAKDQWSLKVVWDGNEYVAEVLWLDGEGKGRYLRWKGRMAQMLDWKGVETGSFNAEDMPCGT